jgi:hypothetical protein
MRNGIWSPLASVTSHPSPAASIALAKPIDHTGSFVASATNANAASVGVWIWIDVV